MLFFHRIEDIRDHPMAVLTPSSSTPVQGTLNTIRSDIWDYHLDHRRWWEPGHNKSPLPTVPPRYGKAFPRLHINWLKKIFRQQTETHMFGFIFDPDVIVIEPPNGVYPCNTDGLVYIQVAGPGNDNRGVDLSLTPFTGAPPDPNPPPPSGSYKVYWRTNRGRGHVDCGSGILIITEVPVLRYGSFNVENDKFNMPPSPGFIFTTLRDEFISNHKVVRLNYLSYLDTKVLRKGILETDPDPLPTTELLWRGVWNVDTNYTIGDIVSRSARTYFALREGKGRDPEITRIFWERCNRPKAQVIAGVGVRFRDNNPVTVSQFRATVQGSTGAQTYFFPGRTDIKPICVRPFTNATVERDWRNFADVFGLQLDAPVGFGRRPFLVSDPAFNIGPYLFYIFQFGTTGLWNGVQNVPVSTVVNNIANDGAGVLFQDTVTTYSITEFLDALLQEEVSP